MAEVSTEVSTEWQRERSLSPKAFKRAVERLGISKSAAARFFGVSESSMRRYLAGTADIPPSIVLLLQLMNELDIEPSFVPKRLRKVDQEPTAQP